jgi:hypothetical protein
MVGISVWRKSLLAACLVVAVAVFAFAPGTPAEARKWNPTPAKLAQDYAVIIDSRDKGEIVGIVWFSPQFGESEQDIAKALDQYILIAVVHARLQVSGNVEFDDTAALELKDADGKPLKLLEGDNVPPSMAGATASLGGMFRQALGPMGQGMHFFVYENGGVHSCKKGRLTVVYAGENYTYDTPFPGCPAE